MERLTTTSWRALTVLALALGFQLSFGQVVYVDQDATGTGDGASWTNAMTNLQAAIDAAATVASVSNPIQVWVKADTYFPTLSTDRTIGIELKNGVELYGGFDGTETQLSQRDPSRNLTIISGDIGTKSDNSDNSYGLVYAGNSVTDYTIIDGFKITGANSIIDNGGATTYGALSLVGNATNLIINNCEVYGNQCLFGSAIYEIGSGNASANVQVLNSIFHDNGSSSLTNTIWVTVNTYISNSIFYSNQGGASIYRQIANLSIVNSTFYGNQGGVYLQWQPTNPTSQIHNSIFWNGSGINVETNSLATLSASNNIVEGGFASGTNTIDEDPLFVDAPNADFTFLHCSPAVNAGDNSKLFGNITTDIAGLNRFFDTTVDIGAHENQVLPLFFGAVEIGEPACYGGSDGQISAAAGGGSGSPVHYSIDGINFSSVSVFSGLEAGDYTVSLLDTGNGCIYGELYTVTEPTDFTVTVSTTSATCNGDTDGIISGTVSGASPPYQVSLNSNVATGQFTSNFTVESLSAGSYNFMVEDGNGCVYNHPSALIVEEPSAITASPTVIDVACFGEATGSFTANASGGSAPLYYTIEGLSSNYLTSPTFENLAAGSYTLTVIDSKLCYEEYQLVIGEPTELTLAVTNATDPTCDGQSDGSITVAASGGTPSYFYSLDGENFDPSGIISNLSAGTYTILVEDENGCRAEVTEVIENQINLSLNTLATTHVSCNGEADGAFEVSLSGGTAFRYFIPNVAPQTSGVFTGLQAGSYEVTGQDTEGCTTTMTVEIQEPDELTVSVTQSGAGFTLTASGGTSPYEYSLDGTTFQASPTFEDLDGGLYTFTVLDANGCTVESADFNLVLSSIQNQLSIYPNPVRDVLKVEGVVFDQLIIYDLAGNRMISTKDHEVSFAGLKSGLYLVTLQDNLGREIATKKILKN